MPSVGEDAESSYLQMEMFSILQNYFRDYTITYTRILWPSSFIPK